MKLNKILQGFILSTLVACTIASHKNRIINRNLVEQTLSSEIRALRRIAQRSLEDRIERGGVAILRDGKVILCEIPNEIRESRRLFDAYRRGENSGYRLLDYINRAAIVRGVCNPKRKEQYFNNATVLMCQLPLTRKMEISDFWERYDSLVMHNIYIKDPDIYEELSKYGVVLFHFHTHPNGTPPSKQDLNLSLRRQEIIISATEEGIELYSAKGGEYSRIRLSEKPEE
ncbi:hypothetical protein D6825_03370 [Candidatus Woesearchaeota archaeon]|nr:MAG: hypothetical protein D6825_03370 [Candidatus Woesearchaeota archaeon]